MRLIGTRSQILGFLYLGLLQLPGLVCIMVWGSILCVFLILVAMGAGLLALGKPGCDSNLRCFAPAGHVCSGKCIEDTFFLYFRHSELVLKLPYVPGFFLESVFHAGRGQMRTKRNSNNS